MWFKQKTDIFNQIKKINPNAQAKNYETKSVDEMLKILQSYKNKSNNKKSLDNKTKSNIIDIDINAYNKDYDTDESSESKFNQGLEFYNLKDVANGKSFDILEKEENKIEEGMQLKAIVKEKTSGDIITIEDSDYPNKQSFKQDLISNGYIVKSITDNQDNYLIDNSNYTKMTQVVKELARLNKEIKNAKENGYNTLLQSYINEYNKLKELYNNAKKISLYENKQKNTFNYLSDEDAMKNIKDLKENSAIKTKYKPIDYLYEDKTLKNIILYHGSPNTNLTDLDLGRNKTNGDQYGVGIYLTTNFEEAQQYAGEKGKVYKVELNNNVNLFNIKNKLTDTIKQTLLKELQNFDNNDIKNYICMFNRQTYNVVDKQEGLKFFKEKEAQWKRLDNKYLGNRPKVTKNGNNLQVIYTDYNNIEQAINNMSGEDLINTLSGDIDPQNFVNIILESGYDGIIAHDDNWYILYKTNISHIINETYNKNKLEEVSRNDMLVKAKSQTITRFNKAAGYKGFSIVDIDTTSVFTTNCLRVTCRVGDYWDTVEMQNILYWIQVEAEKNPTYQINTKGVTAAIMNSIDGMDIKVDCTCADFKYRFAYLATKLGYKYGKPENRPAKITNPNDYGSLCFTGDTLVLTEEGLKPIKDIQIGDNVFTHKGRLRPVLDKSNHYEKKLIKSRIGTENIVCTENHPFYITNKYDINPEWKSLKDCKWVDEVILSPKLQLTEDITLPKGYAFMLGLFLSEGHIDIRPQKNDKLYPNQLTIALDKQYKQKYIDKMKELGINNYRFKEKTYNINTQCINLQIYDKELKKFIIDKGGYTYKDLHSKFLSKECFNWSRQDKLDLINGFFWGDGQFGATGKKDGYLQYILYNSNKDIMQKLYILIRSFTYARIFSMTKKPFFSKKMNKIITPCEHYLITIRGEHIKDILQKDTHFVKTEYSFNHPISNYKKLSCNINEIQYYKTDIHLNKVEQIEGDIVYNLKVAEDESYLVTRELYAAHNCKHLISMLSNKKWLQQVTSTFMDFLVKRIDDVNKFLRPKKGEELTLPNELARQNAKKGFYTKLFSKDDENDQDKENMENDSQNTNKNIKNNNTDNNSTNIEDDTADLEDANKEN